MTAQRRPPGVTAISLFFVFGATMSGLSTVLLSFPGTPLDWLWRLNPRAHQGFSALHGWAVLLMAVVCIACLTASLGLWRRQHWGLWTAVTILGLNLVGDTVNAIVEHDPRALIGIPAAGWMIAYLLTRRRVFTW